ncbi:MAG: hypothetical protein M3281_02865 [Chloroflexota bacterium]|nr:hypothetical protein [Chloroflexota bacterium]
MQLLQALVANDIPIIVLQPLRPGSDVNHFRVVRGYNRQERTVTVNDPVLGPNLVWTWSYFERLWNRRNNSLALIYPRPREPLVQRILERYEQPAQQVRSDRLREARVELKRSPRDPWAWLQLGQTLYFAGRYRDALQAWDRTKELGLPQRAMWYNAWPVGLLNEVGRYQEAIALATQALAKTPGSSELYYERARAWDALGNQRLARRNLYLAYDFAPYHPLYREVYFEYPAE